jgi:hypothetical protein
MLLIPCAEIDTAAAYRLMLNGTAKELAIDRAKCMYREWNLINHVELIEKDAAKARKDERERYEFTIRSLETSLYQEQLKVDRNKPWATLGKFTFGVAIAGGGLALYNAFR